MAVFEFKLSKKVKNKQFGEEIQRMIDEMLLSEKICAEVCLVALIGFFLTLKYLLYGLFYFILICLVLIFITFFGAACGFYIKRKKYEQEKGKYLEYIKNSEKKKND